jgi:hypothetical protein
MKFRVCLVIVSFLSAMVCTTFAQTTTSKPTPASTQVPRLIKFSGVAKDESGKPINSVVGIMFSLYKDQQGGAPLWMETQNVQPDANGHYSVQLGSTQPDGLPTEVFTSGEARWLSVRLVGSEELPRVLLVSVPYAIKAQEAETLGGRQPSEFVLASELKGRMNQAQPNPVRKDDPRQTKTPPPAVHEGAVDFSANTADQVVRVTQNGTGSALIATSDHQIGVEGHTTNNTNLLSFGVQGIADSSSGFGVFGRATNTSGGTVGVEGISDSTAGTGVFGSASALSGLTIGVKGTSNSPTGTGVFGHASATNGSANAEGVFGQSDAPNGIGVNGVATSASGPTTGVFGTSGSTSGNGVLGRATAATGFNFGVQGISASPSGIGVQGVNSASSGGNAVVGSALAKSGQAFGVNGLSASPSGAGLHGVNSASGGNAIQGFATATSGASVGVNGSSASPSGIGVEANNTSLGEFVSLAGPAPFIIDAHTTTTTLFSVDNSGNGFFDGNLAVKGKLTKGSGSFKIDHPLDPENKYLSHSFVESPDMMNIYNGVVVLDARGSAWITMPDYFEALNRDFRYQLTSIGRPQPSLYIAQEMSSRRFRISGGKPGGKVSWMVTGIRQDAYANAHRILTEEEKPPQEQGRYLHPELFGASKEQAIGYRSLSPSAGAARAQVASGAPSGTE